MYVIESKNGMIMNVGVIDCKELDDWCSYENNFMWNPRTCDLECNNAFKVDEYLDFKNCSCEKHLVGKLVLRCEDEILNITEILLNDKKVTCEKSNCFIHTISSIMLCLFNISCHLC